MIRAVRCVCLLTVLLAAMSFSGCVPLFEPKPEIVDPGIQPTRLSPLDEARAALAARDYAKAELLAQRGASRSGISDAELRDFSRVQAIAAYKNNHPNVALDALERWRTADPQADTTREWQDVWCGSMAGLSSWTAASRAEALYQDASRSAQARSMAGIFLAVRYWQDGKPGETMPVLEQLYESAQGRDLKAMMEQRLAIQLNASGSRARTTAMAAVTPENQNRYPYNIILIDHLRGQPNDPEAQAALERLSRETALADPSLLKGLPASPLDASARGPIGPISGKPVILALPMTGPLGNMSAKIVAGADAACREFTAAGQPVTLVVIDTDEQGWIAKIDSLPSEATVVGGLMQQSSQVEARRQGLTARRALFIFSPALEPGEEGVTAWRFFPSTADQIDRLLAFSSSLGIQGYAVFYPDEGYGARMSGMFLEKAQSRGYHVTTASYNPAQPDTWLREVGNLLATNKNPEHARGATFQAVFLPDTWKNMDVIVPNMFYYNETRQLIMGTSLWEQGIAGGGYVSPQYYDLAIFPGAWNSQPLNPAGERLRQQLAASGKGQPDFWSGLGYDFARMSASLNATPGWTPTGINAQLSGLHVDWSMAPMQWDSFGRASQDLYLFTPVENGFFPVDEDAFRRNFGSKWK